MLRKIAFSFTVLTVSLLFVSVSNAKTSKADLKSAEEALKEINAFRKTNGLPALSVKHKLNKAAWKYAEVMASKDKMGHSVDGTTAAQRLTAEGYRYARYFENVAWNKGNANPGAQAVKSWRESTSGHREAMLNREVTEMAVAAWVSSSGKVYFCLVLGKPR